MSAGLPVITSDAKFNGAAEIIKNGYNGISLKNPYNAKELSDKIKLLLESKKLRKKLSTSARKTAEIYTYRKTAAETMKVFKEALKKNN